MNLIQIQENTQTKLIENINEYQQRKNHKVYRNNCCTKLFYTICCCKRKIDTKTVRTIFISEPEYNESIFPNEIISSKYNIFTFLPKTLFIQFSSFGNFIYLLLSLSQLIDCLKVGFLFSYICPLFIVLLVSLTKELIDDLKRSKQDQTLNNELYKKIIIDNFDSNKLSYKTNVIKAKDIKVGDILEITEKKRIPADMILLQTFTSNEDNNIFIKTAQLDGETDFKLRKVPPLLKNAFKNINKLKNAYILIEPPSKEIYSFKGTLKLFNPDNSIQNVSIGLDNTLWSSTILVSEKIYGIVIYTGKETREQMNRNSPRIKYGLLDIEINNYNYILFFIMALLSLFITKFKNFDDNIYTFAKYFFRFIVLLCAIIPISLRINLDISKSFFSYQISHDSNIEGTIVRNSSIPEELGRISYLFCDKTGTLTKNEMVFKKFQYKSGMFTDEKKENLINLLYNEYINPSADKSINNILKECIVNMAICNNVRTLGNNTVFQSINTNVLRYQASSPDEISLVKYASAIGLKLEHVNETNITLLNPLNQEEKYEKLIVFPFSSERKRMGIIVKSKSDNTITFYMKGAENVMSKVVKSEYHNMVLDLSDHIAAEGLRTLVLAKKNISENYYNDWKKEYDEAKTSLDNREENVNKVINKLEKDLEFLCVTGVEDLLQDDVQITVETLKKAGIKMWILTGDKIETAKCISESTGIKEKGQEFYEINTDFEDVFSENIERIKLINSFLEEYKKGDNWKKIIIINGESLNICLNSLRKEFFEAAISSPAVICCRCSPTQKMQVVKYIKDYTTKRTAAIGDGGNDVAMIQESDLGIGIVGKEGIQASQSSDISLLEFKYIQILFTWWGRISYINTSTLSNIIVHRGLIISFIQFIFSLMFYYNPVALFNGFLIFSYSTLYTFLPSISIIFDRDNSYNTVKSFPELYYRLVRERQLSAKIFLIWLFKSLYQGSVIMIGSILIFKEKLYTKIATVTFSELIFIEWLNIYLEIKCFSWIMFCCFISTIIIYVLTFFFLNSLLDIFFIFEFNTFTNIIIITLLCWIPLYATKTIKYYCFRNNYEKLQD